MRRLRLMILGAMALAFTGCLSPAPDGSDREIDEVPSASSLDETAAIDPAQLAAEAATPAASHGPLPFDPCPCTLAICRPGCTNPVKAPPPVSAPPVSVRKEVPPPSHGPLPFDPCPCDNPVCRPVCRDPVKAPPPVIVSPVIVPKAAPLPFEPCPCADPVCRPVCKNP